MVVHNIGIFQYSAPRRVVDILLLQLYSFSLKTCSLILEVADLRLELSGEISYSHQLMFFGDTIRQHLMT